MFYLKSIIICIIIFLTSYLGIIKSQKYSFRVYELKQIKEALSIFKSKIMYTYETIPSIFNEISSLLSGNVTSLFKVSAEKMIENTAQNSWNYAIDNCANSLNKEDIEIVRTLGNLLGKTDKEGQIAEIELVQTFLNSQIDKAEIENSKNEKLYKKLGVLAGVSIGILLI